VLGRLQRFRHGLIRALQLSEHFLCYMYLEARVNCPLDRLLQPSRRNRCHLCPATYHSGAANNSGRVSGQLPGMLETGRCSFAWAKA